MTDRRTIFLDTETTSLRPDRLIWDLGYIVREPGAPPKNDREFQAFIDVDIADADLQSLKIGGYFQRHPDARDSRGIDKPPWSEALHEDLIASQVFRDFTDALIVGAVPWFDTHALEGLLRRCGLLPTWHYHLVDVETLAAGRPPTARPPWSFDTILARYGLTYDEADRHTAIGDARMVRDLYDRVLAPPIVMTMNNPGGAR